MEGWWIFMKNEIKSILIGIAGGIGAGLIGIGGGIIMVPCMVSILGVPQHKAHATSLVAIAPLAFISAIVYNNYGNLNIYLACLLSVGGIIGAYIGASLMPHVNKIVLRCLLAILCIAMAIKMGVGF